MKNSLTSIFITVLCCSSLTQAEELSVAVAANFSAPMQVLVTEFEQQYGHQLVLSFGSSGKFFAQISHGAPYDVFFSADQTKPQALIEQQLAVAASRFTYASGALALWSAQVDKVDQQGQVLNTNKFNKLALANPKLAPYGVAAMDVLTNLQMLEQTKSKWVQGENIAQTYQFVASQNADIGFVALSQISLNGKLKSGSAWIVPTILYRPIQQDAVILNRARDKQSAIEFMQFMQSPKTRERIHSFGYHTGQP